MVKNDESEKNKGDSPFKSKNEERTDPESVRPSGLTDLWAMPSQSDSGAPYRPLAEVSAKSTVGQFDS